MNRSRQFPLLALTAVVAATTISGAAGLAYEVAWSTMLMVPLGNSADATALVLAAFMLGIALGAWMLGRLADRIRSPLKLYALLELLLGLWALLMPFLIGEINSIEPLIGTFDNRLWAAIGRSIAVCCLVALPSLAMGATVPVLVRALSATSSDVQFRIGLIYGANTIGAALGAALAGFAVIPTLGLTLTSTIAAGASFVAAIIVFTVCRLLDERSLQVHTDSIPSSSDNASGVTRPVAIAALTAAAVSGFAMLAAEVLWARILTFVFGHDTYAFAVLLTVVLAGLGAGGLIHRRLAGRDPVLVSGVLIGLLAMALIDSFWIAASLIVQMGRDPFGLGAAGNLASSLRLEFYREILFTPILVFIPAVLAGAAFPAACVLYGGPMKQLGRRLGIVTLVSGLGSAVGALATSFCLVTWLGIQGAFFFVAALLAATSVLVVSLGGQTRRIWLVILPLMVTAFVAFVMPASLPKAMLREAVGARHQRILHYEEGRCGTVSVTQNVVNGEKQLFMNTVNEVTTRLVHDQSFKLLGHLGPLLHPYPKKGLMICFGAGLSAGAALVHPLARLDVVELSPAMPRAARLWSNENNGVLNDSRLHLHIADGRHFLYSTKDLYDVVMVDSTHPKAVDSWFLYTKEFYELVSDRIADDGIVVQWVPLHGLSEQEFKIIVRSFRSVFKEITLWVNVGFEIYGQAAYVKMVGTKKPLLIDFKELALRLNEPRIKRDLLPMGMAEPEELLDCFLAGPQAVAAWTDGIPVQTDDHPIVPFTTAFSSGRRMEASLLLSIHSPIQPLLRRMGRDEPKILKKLENAFEAQGFLLAGLLDRAAETRIDGKKIRLFREQAAKGRDYYLALAKIYKDDASKLFEIGNYLGNLGHSKDASLLYERAKKFEPLNLRTRINHALILNDLGDHVGAVKTLSKIVKADPNNTLALYNLGVTLKASGDPEAAISHLERACELAPDLVGARLALSDALLEIRRLNEAEVELKEVIAWNRWIAEAWDMLGLVAAGRRDWARAQKHHIRALGLEPYRAAAHYNLGIAFQESGKLKEAALAYLAALRIEPDDALAQNNLGLTYAAVGLYDLAIKAHSKALDIEPNYAEAAFNLGLAYRALDQTLAAQKAFGLALKIAPNLTPARKQLNEMGIDQVEIEASTTQPE